LNLALAGTAAGSTPAVVTCFLAAQSAEFVLFNTVCFRSRRFWEKGACPPNYSITLAFFMMAPQYFQEFLKCYIN
jgi:hypothetical protein